MRRNVLISILIILSFVLAYLIATEPTHTQIYYTNKQSDSISKPITKEVTSQTKDIPPIPDKIKNTTETKKIINHSVPFTSQAPTGDWADKRQQDGCEEASALMAMYWTMGKSLSKEEALTKILAISDFEQNKYGEYRDISLTDIKDWIFNDYFKYTNVEIQINITETDIIKQLEAGNIILLPMNGQKLNNPYFTAPGPERHMIIIRGHDPKTNEFITNDPGTKRGEGFRYSIETIMKAILVYPTGYHAPANDSLKNMLVVKK